MKNLKNKVEIFSKNLMNELNDGHACSGEGGGLYNDSWEYIFSILEPIFYENERLKEVVKFYASCPINSGIIEAEVSGEFIALGTTARNVLIELEEKNETN